MVVAVKEKPVSLDGIHFPGLKEKPENVNIHKEKEEDIKLRRFERYFQFRTNLVWPNVFFIFSWYVISFYYVFTFPYLRYKGLMIWAFILAELNILSNTAGAHRLWSHHSYKAKLPLRIFLAVFYISSGLNRISHWVRDHRLHHKYADTDGDPYNSTRGIFFSHIGWQMMKKHPDIIRFGKTIDYKDALADPVVVLFDTYYPLWKMLLCFFLPVFIPVYFFGQDLGAAIVTQWFFRYTYEVNMVLTINSLAHLYGYRSYDKTIRPSENGLVSLLVAGEGWHNYHHSFPWDYKAAEMGNWFFNRSTAMINLFEKIGWAYDLKQVQPELVKRLVKRKGDGSHAVYASDGNQDKIELVGEQPY